jgi:hypothetical protein
MGTSYLRITSVHNVVLLDVEDNNPEEYIMYGDKVLLGFDGQGEGQWYEIIRAGGCGGENPNGRLFILTHVDPIPSLSTYGLILFSVLLALFILRRWRKTARVRI